MLRGGLPGARWIDPDNYHLTLRFIGDVDDSIAHEVASLLGTVKRSAFELRLEGLTSFGGRKPRAVVAAVAPAQPLLEVQAEHERLMQRIGLEPEGPQIHAACHARAPARIPRAAQVAEYLSARGYFRTAAFRVSRFVLFSSRASVGGGPYVVEASYPLRGLTRQRPAYSSNRDCTSSIAVAKPWLSASNSRISDSGGGARRRRLRRPRCRNRTDRSASNLRASCCMRRLSARHAMCSDLMPRLRAVSSVRSSSAVPTPWLCQAARC